MHSWYRWSAAIAALLWPALATAQPASAVASGETLADVLERARRSNPSIRRAAAAVDAAVALERQVSRFENPVLSYAREQTSRGAQRNAQDIVQVAGGVDVGGIRRARAAAAAAHTRVARFERERTEHLVLGHAVRAFGAAAFAARRVALADSAAAALTEAVRIATVRLDAGDASPYEVHRLRLELARAVATQIEARAQRDSASAALRSIQALGPSGSVILDDSLGVTAILVAARQRATRDSTTALVERSVTQRPDLRAAAAALERATASERVDAREGFPVPQLSVGVKREQVADPLQGSIGGFRGVVAGVALPLPIFDRRRDAVVAARAEVERADLARAAIERDVSNEVTLARAAWRAVDDQRAALAPLVGLSAEQARRAITVAFAEGESSVVEWLDGLRAYLDAEHTYAKLAAELLARSADLLIALGESPADALRSPSTVDRP